MPNFFAMSMTACGGRSAQGVKKSLRRTHHALVDTSKPDGIDLRNICGFSLQELLEDDPILRHLTSRHAYAVRLQRFAYRSVPEDVVGTCRLWGQSERFAARRPRSDPYLR